MKVVTLYSKPACGQCTASERKFEKNGVTYTKENLPDLPEKLAAFKEQGHLQAPVVEVVDEAGNVVDTWHGFRPDKINEHFPQPVAA